MTIVMTGGGSGGHITPILAVAAELKKLRPDIRLVYIGQRGDLLADIPAKDPNIDEVFSVSAGKFRRYHGEGLKQLLDVKTGLLNIRDLFRVVTGFFQSRRLLKKTRPEIVFTRGGFVSVPVALAASSRHIPFITHDSDAIPSLANRLIAHWAKVHTVALPETVYTAYPRQKTVTVGVPIVGNYQLVTPQLKATYRHELDIAPEAQLLFVIGGGLGAQRVNEAMASAASALLKAFPDLQIVHAVGRANEQQMLTRYSTELALLEQGRVQVRGYLEDVYRYSGAADVVITRAGATNLAEFAVQGKACIVIPNPFLTGGHQLKNAAYLQQQQAAELVAENDLKDGSSLQAAVRRLLNDPALCARLGKNFASFGRPDAAHDLAVLLLEQIKP